MIKNNYTNRWGEYGFYYYRNYFSNIIYNLICYSKKLVIYTIKSKKFRVINEDFYKMQLGLSVVNSLFVLINSYIYDKVNEPMGFLLFTSMFWGINYLIKYSAILKVYATK